MQPLDLVRGAHMQQRDLSVKKGKESKKKEKKYLE
jgi:hypothetical protein